MYLLGNGKYRNTTGHFELAVLDAGGQLLSELSPDAIGPDLHRIYGQFSLQKEQRIRGRAIVLTVLQAGLFEDAFTASRNFVWLHGCPLPAGPI